MAYKKINVYTYVSNKVNYKELNYENLKQFKTNLLNRKVPFTIEKKRNEI